MCWEETARKEKYRKNNDLIFVTIFVLTAVREDRMPGGRNSGALYNMYKVCFVAFTLQLKFDSKE